MEMTPNFDCHVYGCVSINLMTGFMRVGERGFGLNTSDANLVAIFINLANQDQRASLKTMTELSSAKSQNSFRARLSQLRAKLCDFEIARGVNASALLLSDRLVGNQNEDHSNGQEKKPYHFNTALEQLIAKYGFELPSEKLQTTRLESTRVIGPLMHPQDYDAGLR